MFLTAEQISSTNEIAAETVQSLYGTFFTTIERLSALNLSASRHALGDAINNTRSLLAAKDGQDLIGLAPAISSGITEKVTGYSREVYEILTRAREEVSSAIEKQANEQNRNLADILDKAAKNAPAGSDVTIAAMRSAFAAANSAYDSLNKAKKQIDSFVDANIAATSKAVDVAAAAATNATSSSKGRKAA